MARVVNSVWLSLLLHRQAREWCAVCGMRCVNCVCPSQLEMHGDPYHTTGLCYGA